MINRCHRYGRIAICLYATLFAALAYSETLAEIGARLGRDTESAYSASPYSKLSQDYFARFVRDPDATPQEDEVAIDDEWAVVLPAGSADVVKLMAEYFLDFMDRRMDAQLTITEDVSAAGPAIVVQFSPITDAPPESFSVEVEPARVTIAANDPGGVRDAFVKLVDRIGFRGAPFLAAGKTDYRPRLPVRLGAIPKLGSYRELVFLGYNAVFSGGGSLFALSESDAIPELADRRQPGLLGANRDAAAEARRHALKTYAFLDTRQKFPEDHPVFAAHPEIRGARTWQADGEFVLCTEHPLVQQWLRESVAGLFAADAELTGIVLIIGGEGFYHCYMRPYGVEKGRTNCERCNALDAETVVANLCNLLADAARSVSTTAEVVVWPYSAAHVWSVDPSQIGFIEKLKPGVALLTEIEKDEYVEKPGGINKHLWDYSIDLIGPGERAKAQIAACREAGINVYLKSEPELAFEAARLPHIPCMDRWFDRAEALASCGATGAWVFPAFRPNYGTSAAEVGKFAWWTPAPDKEVLLRDFAARLVGDEAGPLLREAWRHVSAAIPLSPVIPPYYKGPQYLGPAHPMVADPTAELPAVFYGHYLFLAEITDAEGLKTRPTFETKPYGDAALFGEYYRKMEGELEAASKSIKEAHPLVPDAYRLMFDAEASPVEWFYRTTRTTANFYEACQLRDMLLAAAEQAASTEDDADLERAWRRWRAILDDERANTEAAIPLAENDMRLDFYYGSDHTFPHAVDMMRAKLALLDHEIGVFLPEIAAKLGIANGN